MTETSSYLIDANVFIQAKNFHYRFEFCQAFWQWLEDAHQAGVVFSIDKVKKELKDGKKEDSARLWAESMSNEFFIDDVKDAQIMTIYRDVMQWSVTNSHYKQQAKDEFARFDKADAFLIAAAKAYGHILVTHELSNPESKKRILIPDAANALNVKSIQIYDLLSHHASGNFAFTL
jgi:Domain of unknown function (DUF4411)